MKIYFAPLETITGYRYRQIHNKYFNNISKYFIPFISPTINGITNKEKREIDPNNNKLNSKVVPQILSKNPIATINLINELIKLGYDEVNLNFACPSQTVVPKGKGGGMLADLEYMDYYLNEIFNNCDIKISIKIRLGINNELEFDKIIEILNKYPIYELIIHARCVKDYYKGEVHLDYFESLKSKTNLKIIYNGDILDLEDINNIEKRFPFIDGIMIGRGLIINPGMLEDNIDEKANKDKIYKFYTELIKENRKDHGSNNSLHYEKELLFYMLQLFDVPKKLEKEINKCKSVNLMDQLVNDLFSNYKMINKK